MLKTIWDWLTWRWRAARERRKVEYWIRAGQTKTCGLNAVECPDGTIRKADPRKPFEYHSPLYTGEPQRKVL